MGTAVRKVDPCQDDNGQRRDRRASPERLRPAPEFAGDPRIKRYGVIYQKQLGRSECFIVSIRRRGRTYTRRFASSRHGGLAAALEAAITWRNGYLVGASVFTLREFHARVRSN